MAHINNSIVRTIYLIMVVILPGFSFGQGGSDTQSKVKQVDWKAIPCDDTYDPYRLITRITEIRAENGPNANFQVRSENF